MATDKKLWDLDLGRRVSPLGEVYEAFIEIAWQVLEEGQVGREEFEQRILDRIYGKEKN